MNFSTHTALLAALMVALVAMFALGFYWLAAKRRSMGVRSPIAPPPVRGATVQRSAFDISELDEWEALAHYPDHVLHATHEASAQPPDAHSPFGRSEEPAYAPYAPDIRHDLRDTIEDLISEAATPEPASAKPGPSSSEPVLRCPRCLSSRIDTRNRARKAGSAIGSVAGATGGMAAALAGAETGAVVGSIAGPIGTVFGGLAGAVIAGLVGSAAGCAAGSAVGSAVDDNLLDNYQCLACTHSFSVKQAV
ncbi:Uncharacterised protein [Burkholderia pseudomallei]|uniref:hypothetical protein n=1 Tax=Burkholderia pseudomallei TaxID=28450 RepID=UPI000F1B53C0|nr:hypothetical protein [Burkholderia pseudomallei]CAJ3148534.1 Uncharacterised protein [Burkholderia pseudomallei]VCN38376.1 Uncharacterised protein [Burkholderia pseudomallei]VCN49699.1 Uncharacterised protein [Burkholderia pseudomallei]VCN64759.1 Uncharacterised protein [Burkholderia pseudomallei]VCN69680.1 Uncharacterised protein [Burkholderia pseudomallei]